MKEGKAFVQSRRTKQAVAEFREAINEDPACTEAHTQFIRAVRSSYLEASHFSEAGNFEALRKRMDRAEGEANQYLRTVYAAWAKKFPKNEAVFDWALGTLYPTKPEIASAYYQKALLLDPRLGPAAAALGNIAQSQGDDLTSRRYYSQAAHDDPGNADFRFDYLMTFRDHDVRKYRELTEDFVHRFPSAGRAPQSLVYLATVLDRDADKIEVLERLRLMYSPKELAGYGMDELFDAYARTDPEKAIQLAQMLTRSAAYPSLRPTYESWLKYAQALARIGALIHKAKLSEAVALAKQTYVPKDRDSAPLVVLRAEAEYRSGDSTAAYEGLVRAEAGNPNPEVEAKLRRYSAELKKSPSQTLDDVWRVREREAKLVPDFQLTDFQTDKPVKLSDYRGEVVLLDFFFPT